jgi:hypothetical protein
MGQDGHGPGSDDPLVELARIVSGRSAPAAAAGRPEKPLAPAPQPQPEVPPRAYQPLPSEADLARDLESELLNELQASFSSIPEIVGRPRAPQPKAPPTPPPVYLPEHEVELPDLSLELPEELEAQPEMSFRPPAASPVAGGARQLPQQRQPQPQPQPYMPPARAEPPAPPRAEQPMPPRGEQLRPPAGPKRESLASRIAKAARSGEHQEPETPPRMDPPEPQRGAAQRPARSVAVRPRNPNARPEAGNVPFKPTLAPNATHAQPPTSPPRQPSTRWDPDPELGNQPKLDASRFAPQRIAAARPDESRPPPSLPELPTEADYFDDEPPFAAANDAFFEELPAGENYEMVPGYGDEELPPYPDEDLSAYEPKRSRRGPMAIAALLVIAVVGGAAVVMLRSGTIEGDPPVITADATPTKVTPDSAGASEADGQSKLIYDRVDPGTEVADSQLVITGDQAIADIPPIPDDTTSEVSRVILGGGPGFDSGEESDPSAPIDLTDGMGTTIASSGSTDSEPIGPKKVRTVVVRPDGTIVSSEATSPGDQPAIADLPPASETPPAPAAEDNPLLSDDFGVEAIDNPTPDTPAPDTPARDNPIANPESVSVPDIPQPPSASAPTPRAPAASSPTIVATTGASNGPIDVTPGSGSQATAARGGGFMIQVSSQRSEEVALATFQELQRRYPGVLGDRQPDIQRADLGERGVYYRVRVGYPTRDEAVRMCENLKASGGDCLLATR